MNKKLTHIYYGAGCFIQEYNHDHTISIIILIWYTYKHTENNNNDLNKVLFFLTRQISKWSHFTVAVVQLSHHITNLTGCVLMQAEKWQQSKIVKSAIVTCALVNEESICFPSSHFFPFLCSFIQLKPFIRISLFCFSFKCHFVRITIIYGEMRWWLLYVSSHCSVLIPNYHITHENNKIIQM